MAKAAFTKNPDISSDGIGGLLIGGLTKNTSAATTSVLLGPTKNSEAATNPGSPVIYCVSKNASSLIRVLSKNVLS